MGKKIGDLQRFPKCYELGFNRVLGFGFPSATDLSSLNGAFRKGEKMGFLQI